MILIKEIEPQNLINCVSSGGNDCPNKAIINIQAKGLNSNINLCKKCSFRLIKGIYKRFIGSLDELLKEILFK